VSPEEIRPEDQDPAADPETPDASTKDTPAPADAAAEPSNASEPKYVVGQRVWGQILRLSEERAVVALGERGLEEGQLDLIHLRDEFGNLSVSEGDEVQAYVVRVEPSIKLAPTLFPPAAEVMSRLKEAMDKGEAVRGRVTGTNRGGLDVQIDGRRAFCPFSHIEIGRCERPEIYVNQLLDFRVAELDEEKKRIVVSRRAILEEARREKLHELRAQIKEGAIFDGVVTRLQPFGAFVDIGGIDGLVHVSEMSFDRIDHPSKVLRRGEKVRVRVMGISPGKDGKERIRLSIKALMEDPWTTIDRHFHEGDIITGMVTRVTDFGAFVKLMPGIEGLLHVSQYKPRDPRGPAPATPAVTAEAPSSPPAAEEAPPPESDAPVAAPADGAAPSAADGTPAVQSAEPAVQSAEPAVQSAEPAVQSAEPAVQPAEPAVQPAEPAVQPAEDGGPVTPVASMEITIKISRIDRQRRRISLALRDEEQHGERKLSHDAVVGEVVEGVVRAVKPYGVFLDLPSVGPWVSGLLPGAETGLGRETNLRRKFPQGEKVRVEIIDIDDQGRIRLSRRSLIEAAERGETGAAGVSKGSATSSPGGFTQLAEALKKARGKGPE
jgi:small subunit ribosomal protein S1